MYVLDRRIDKYYAFYKSTLNEKEVMIFKERLLKQEKATLEDLSLKLGVSKERVRQIENEIKGKLKKFLNENFKEVADCYIK